MDPNLEVSSVERTIKAWDDLDQEDRERLIPRFLHSIGGWRARSYRSSSQLRWLEVQFRDAGIPFVESVTKTVSQL